MTTLAATMAACSDSTDAGGSGGAGGAVATAGAGGAVSTAGTGTGGAAACTFKSTACQGCLAAKCQDQVVACSTDAMCKGPLGALPDCACSTTPTDECQATFVTDGGDSATKLAECYTLNCEASCQ